MNNPGCFGSVIYHDMASRRCGACQIKKSCSELVETNKQDLTAWYNALAAGKKTTASPKRVDAMNASITTKVHSTTTDKTVVVSGVSSNSLNKKPREFVEKWMAKGIKFDAYKTGSNPFELSGNKFAVVAMDFFLKNPGGITKGDLTDELVAKCGSKGQGWGLGTAASHAGIVIEAFEYLGIIYKNEGKIYLR